MNVSRPAMVPRLTDHKLVTDDFLAQAADGLLLLCLGRKQTQYTQAGSNLEVHECAVIMSPGIAAQATSIRVPWLV